MRTILLVEDNDMQRQLLRTILEKAGFSVIACRDGESAIEQALHRAIDVMLIDYRMPGLNGVDVLKIISESHPRACIIGMSVENREISFLEAGADVFLNKPIDIDELVRIAGAGSDDRKCVSR
jgi:DNA-binding response OmpR family regulator